MLFDFKAKIPRNIFIIPHSVYKSKKNFDSSGCYPDGFVLKRFNPQHFHFCLQDKTRFSPVFDGGETQIQLQNQLEML